jgi:hypothetical protein
VGKIPIAGVKHVVLKSKHFEGDDCQYGHEQKNAARDHWCPKKAPAMLPEFAFDQPIKGFHA